MSFVRMLDTDSEMIADPSWADVTRAILKLDGRTATMVTLAPPVPTGVPEGNSHMAISGGEDGLFNVYMTSDNQKFWNLVDPAKANDTRVVRMTIGGQIGEYSMQQFVPLEMALRAANQYLQDGRPAQDLTWTIDG